jgi:hypothetical protein
MRSLLAGISALQRAPAALAPLTIEGLILGALIVAGAIPARAAYIGATAAFPLDVYFDLKHALAFAHSWPFFLVLVFVSLVVRAGVLGATLWLAEDGRASLLEVWKDCARLAAIAIGILFPVAALFFVGTATRYAPFLWIAAPLGFAAAVSLVRRAVRIGTGEARSGTIGVPEAATFLSYAFLVMGAGATLSALGDKNRLLAALFVACLGPMHAVFLVGWKEHARLGTFPSGGGVPVAVTVVIVLAIAAATVYDRYVRSAPPVARAEAPGTLALLGGADSTSESGSLSEFDPRSVGYRRARSVYLSYAGNRRPYSAADTRGDLDQIAGTISEELGSLDEPVRMLGHSQAALILDRLIEKDLELPQGVVVFAAPPPYPPDLTIPPPDQTGPGRVGGDVARAFAKLLDVVDAGYDIDAGASPTNLEPVVVGQSRIPRLSIWALADAVWLDRDWRRPGEVNVVSVTDHVGVTNNARAIAIVSSFFNGNPVVGDEASWRGALVSVVRYAFEPWRPV